jgi:glycoside/pentoside/hexuronide:cation symporter, GPH family
MRRPAMMPRATAFSGKLRVSTKLLYGLGTVAFGVKDQGFSYLLLIFYNQVVGLPSATVGLAILIALLVDSLLDPIMGQISDNWRSRWGRRHPFMYAAALPVALSYLLLWSPPVWSPQWLFYYLIGVAVLIRSFITMYEIPSSALAPELTSDYDERTNVLSYRQFFGWFGGLVMTILALQVFLRPDATHAVGQLNPAGYQAYAYAAAAVMFAAIMVSSLGTHRYIPQFRVPPVRKVTLGQTAREMVESLGHRSFLFVMAAGFFNAMVFGLTLSLSLYLSTYFWRLSSGQISLLAAANFISAALAFALAAPLARRLGKKRATMLTQVFAFAIAAMPICLRFLGPFPTDDSAALVPSLFLSTALSTAFAIASAILISSMLADVVEDSEVRTGRRSEGLFFASAAFVAKATSGVGIFASSMILLAISFPQAAKPGEVSPDIIRDLGVVYLIVLALLYTAAMVCISFYGITREDHAENLRKLSMTVVRVEEQESSEFAVTSVEVKEGGSAAAAS